MDALARREIVEIGGNLEGIQLGRQPLLMTNEELFMHTNNQIPEHADVIGADGVHVGTVDHVEGNRIKLTKADSGEGSHAGHHHFVDMALVGDVEGDVVRLTANADVAVTFEVEEDGKSVVD